LTKHFSSFGTVYMYESALA